MRLNKKNAVSIENPEYLIRNPNTLIRDEKSQYASKSDFDKGWVKGNMAVRL